MHLEDERLENGISMKCCKMIHWSFQCCS